MVSSDSMQRFALIRFKAIFERKNGHIGELAPHWTSPSFQPNLFLIGHVRSPRGVASSLGTQPSHLKSTRILSFPEFSVQLVICRSRLEGRICLAVVPDTWAFSFAG